MFYTNAFSFDYMLNEQTNDKNNNFCLLFNNYIYLFIDLRMQNLYKLMKNYNCYFWRSYQHLQWQTWVNIKILITSPTPASNICVQVKVWSHHNSLNFNSTYKLCFTVSIYEIKTINRARKIVCKIQQMWVQKVDQL